jgi:nucleotide-binding universal stress UspA family protein
MSTAARKSELVVAVDGSPESDAAVAWAAREGAMRDAQVTLLHVISPVLVSVPVDPMFSSPDFYEQSARHILEHAEKTVHWSWTGAGATKVRTVTAHADIVPTLVQASKAAQLVVVGNRGRGRLARLLLGSVSSGLLHHAHCPVAVLRAEADTHQPGGPIVVGIDGSAAGEAATALAFDEASRRGAELIALHAWSDVGIDLMLDVDWHQYRDRGRALLTERLAGWQERYPDVRVQQRVVCDEPAYWLAEEARRAQLVVVGSRGRGGFAEMLLGSTSSAVAQTSPAPVIVVRGRRMANGDRPNHEPTQLRAEPSRELRRCRDRGATMSMERVQHCEITIVVDEREGGGQTRAVARMDWRGRKLVGVGRTRPYELLPDRAAEKLSVSRALSELIARLDAADLDGASKRPRSAS